MMKRTVSALLLVASATLIPEAAIARDLGAPAPPLQIAQWYNGAPVKLADGKDKNIYVIEFWETTCPYSRACVPHLTELQRKYKDKGVIVIGVSPESADKVAAYAKEMGDKLGYRLAADNNKRTDSAYRGAYRIRQAPYAFLVDKAGNVVWHGHPMSGLDKIIDGVLDGTYSVEQGRRWAKAREFVGEYFAKVKSLTQSAKAREVGDKVLEYGEGEVLLLNDFAWMIATEPGLMKRDLDLAQKAIALANKGAAGKNPAVLDTYARVMFVSDKKKDAVEYEKKAVQLAETPEERKQYEKSLAEYVKAAGD